MHSLTICSKEAIGVAWLERMLDFNQTNNFRSLSRTREDGTLECFRMAKQKM